jgi:flagellar basal-body rod protein FlgC
MMDFKDSMAVSASGLRAQSLRMRILAENIANQDSVSTTAGVDPYRRKIISFRAAVDRETGMPTVKIDRIVGDKSDFGRKYMPGHPAANAQGYVVTPNVNGIIEASDMREAQRSYEANLNAIDAAKSMAMRTIDMLR